MKVVIEIPRYIAALCVENNISDPIDIETLTQAVKNGIPLPKGHGDLIDIDELNLFAKEHEIGNSAYDGELIYSAGETKRHDTIWKPLSDVLNVVIKADGGNAE